MNQQTELGQRLLHSWLMEIDPFDCCLDDTGKRFQNYPVFSITAKFPNDESYTVKVYRWTPTNSQWPVLSFVPYELATRQASTVPANPG